MKERAVPLLCFVLAAALIGLAACGSDQGEGGTQAGAAGSAQDQSGQTSNGESGQSKDDQSSTQSRRVDPRAGGLEISLGEWAVTPEAKAIRPGRTTLVIKNRGTMDHGFEIEADFDHSGSGGGEGFKFETNLIAPGETVKVPLNLTAGVYKIECLVEGHDDMGMENFLRVEAGAPLVAERKSSSKSSDVSIKNFEFAPAALDVPSGTRVTWVNDDPTEHTVTEDGSDFDSESIEPGDDFSVRLDEPGTYSYHCAIHPDMKARIRVSK